MGTIIKQSAALVDISEIWSYIADDSPDQAMRFLAKLENTFRVLSRQPQMGRLRDELAPELRSFPQAHHVIFYLPTATGVEIVRVIHSARDISIEDFNA